MGLNCTTYNYCPGCSQELVYIEIEGKQRKHCEQCNYIYWGECSIGVGGVLLKDSKGLIVQRANNPGKGRWTIPGGYVEQDEKIEDAIVRELREETGLITEAVSVLAVRDRPQDLPGLKHDIYIVFLLRYVSGELKPDLFEVSQANFYTPEECEDLNIAPLSLHVIKEALTQATEKHLTPGLVRKKGIQMVGALSELYSMP